MGWIAETNEAGRTETYPRLSTEPPPGSATFAPPLTQAQAERAYNMRRFATGATRDAEREKLDYEAFLSPVVLERYAEYMHKHRIQAGADGISCQPRDGDNWQKGIPRSSYRKSLIRHVIDLWRTWRTDGSDEAQAELLCAVMFNSMGLLNEILVEREIV